MPPDDDMRERVRRALAPRPAAPPPPRHFLLQLAEMSEADRRAGLHLPLRLTDDPALLDETCRFIAEGSLKHVYRARAVSLDVLYEWINAKPERVARVRQAQEDFERTFPRCYNSEAFNNSFGVLLGVTLVVGVAGGSWLTGKLWQITLGLVVGFAIAHITYFLTRRRRDPPPGEMPPR